MNEMAPPFSSGLPPLDETKQLVHALNTPGNAFNIESTQRRLQGLQKCELGWDIADGLLHSEDVTERFFGALTLTVKIHHDWNNLNQEMAEALLLHLLNYFLLLVQRNEAPVVLRKHMTTLSTFFFKPNAPWTMFIRHTAMCIANEKFVKEEDCNEQTLSVALPLLSPEKLYALLSFSITLGEDSTSHLHNTNNELQERLAKNVPDAIFMSQFLFQVPISNCSGNLGKFFGSEQIIRTVYEAIRCLNVWLSVARACRMSAAEIRNLSAVSLDCITQFIAVPSLAGPSMELLTGCMERKHHPVIVEFLSGPQGEQYAMSMLEGDENEESIQFIDLLTAYSRDNMKNLLINEPTSQAERILFLLKTLFRTPSISGSDDRITSVLLEFWIDAADFLTNDEMLTPSDLSERTKGELIQVIRDCFPKLRYPDSDYRSDWNDDDWQTFSSLRRDFSEYLLAAYPLVAYEIIQLLYEATSAAMRDYDWNTFETAIYLLGTLAEYASKSDNVRPFLDSITRSPAFDDICFNRIPIPRHARRQLACLITSLSEYIEQNRDLLLRVLNFLFNSLETPYCDMTASKCISSFCQKHQGILVNYVQEFINKFISLRNSSGITPSSLERVSEGISSVIQMADSDIDKANMLLALLEPLEILAGQAAQKMQENNPEEALQHGTHAIRCTASIGKGYRAPDDAVINLDDDSDNSVSEPEDGFWSINGPGGNVQRCVIRILDILTSTLPNDPQIISSACEVLRAGFTESKPGPYLLPSEFTVRFIRVTANLEATVFSTIMGTASAFLSSSQVCSQPARYRNHIMELIVHVSNLMSSMGSDDSVTRPDQFDPEIAYSCLDFLVHLLPRHSETFFMLTQHAEGSAVLTNIMRFSLSSLTRPDPLPLRSASAFWATLLSINNKPPEFKPSAGLTAATGYPSYTFFDECLSSLSRIIIHQISGACARSDLDHLTKIIRKYVFHYEGAARLHLGNALTPEAQPSSSYGGQAPESHLAAALTSTSSTNPTLPHTENNKARPTEAEKRRFLAQITSLRGSPQTLKVVKDYWILCRGKAFNYTT